MARCWPFGYILSGVIRLQAAKHVTRFKALQPVRQAMRDCRDGFRENAAAGIEMRHN
jgi:hypothetical protein